MEFDKSIKIQEKLKKISNLNAPGKENFYIRKTKHDYRKKVLKLYTINLQIQLEKEVISVGKKIKT